MAVSAGELDDDRALVYAVQQGDTEAFSALFSRHYSAVRKACARRLGNVFEADEVAQAAFVRALERIQQCQGDRRFGPWVHVIARYLCIDTIRARARVTPEEEPVPESHSGGGLPEDGILDRERNKNVHLALAQLPERQRDVVIARTFENRRPVEIAASLGLSVAAVDSLLLRARRGLALAYERVAGEGGTAATVTSASAASALGGTLAVGPARVVDGVASAGQALSHAAGEMASTAASMTPVKGIGAGVASVVMAASLALTGSAPSSPVDAPSQSSATTEPGAALVPSTPFGLPASGLAGTVPGTTPAPTGIAGGTAADGLLGGSLLDNGSIVESLVNGPVQSRRGPAGASPGSGGQVPLPSVPLGAPRPELGGAVDDLTSALGLPPAIQSVPTPSDPGTVSRPTGLTVPVPGVAGTVTGTVDEVAGTVGQGLEGLVPSGSDVAPGVPETITTLVAPGLDPPSKPSRRDRGPDPVAPVSDLTGAVGGLLD